MKTESHSGLARSLDLLLALACMLAAGAVPCRAQATSTAAMSRSGFFSAIKDYFLDWFPRVTRIQSKQPHWVTPIVTVTPRLEEEFRYDQFWQVNPTNGQREGETQVFVTPGIIIGRIPIYERVGITAGFGYQVAVTSRPMYNHAAILTGRVPF